MMSLKESALFIRTSPFPRVLRLVRGPHYTAGPMNDERRLLHFLADLPRGEYFLSRRAKQIGPGAPTLLAFQGSTDNPLQNTPLSFIKPSVTVSASGSIQSNDNFAFHL